MGFRKFMPQKPMSIEWLVERAGEFGLDGIQLADNLFPETFSDSRCMEIGVFAKDKGIELQWGFDGWDREKIDRMMEICQLTGSGLLRGVFGPEFVDGFSGDNAILTACRKEIDILIPKLEKNGIVLALENHFDLSLPLLRQLVSSYDRPEIRVCLDTTNALGQLWRPLDVVQYLAPLSTSMHFKDFTVKKVIGGYEIMGVAIGAGDQNCYEILQQALKINPEMEICIELGTPRPDGEAPYVENEIKDVNHSIEVTKTLLKRFYEEISL